MNPEMDKVFEQIKKLLRLSQDGGASESEAQSAMNLAQNLALKHGLSLENIDLNDSERNTARVQGQEILLDGVNRIEWKAVLIRQLAYTNGCFFYWDQTDSRMSEKGKRLVVKNRLILIGTEMNRFMVKEGFRYLEEVVEVLAKEELADTERIIRIKELFMPDGLNRREFLSSFKIGCAERLSERLYDDYKKRIATPVSEKCTAIVVANYYLECRKEAEEFVTSKTKLYSTKVRVKDTSDKLGHRLGRQAANTVDLNPQKELK